MIKLAFRNLLRNKRKSSVLILALTLATALILFSRFLAYGIHEETIWQTVHQDSGYLQINANGWLENPILERALEVTPSLLAELEKYSEILVVSPRIQAASLISLHENTHFIQVRGFDPDKEKKITSLEKYLIEGQVFQENDVRLDKAGRKVYPMIVGKNLLVNLSAHKNSVLSLVTTQFDGSVGAVLVEVTGVLSTGNLVLDNGMVFISLTAAKELFGTQSGEKGLYTALSLGVKDLATADEIYHKLKEKFPEPHLQNGVKRETSENYDPVIHDWRDLNPGVLQLMELDQLGNEISLAFVIFIMVFGILNVVQMSIHERRRELGILIAIGTTPYRLFLTFLLEILLLMVPGLLMGILVGGGYSFYLENNPIVLSGGDAEAFQASGFAAVLKAKISLNELLIGLATILIPTFLVVSWAGRRILKLNPIDAINER